jgi:WD40 repeat protein
MQCLLLQPTHDELEEALKEAVESANQRCKIWLLKWPLPGLSSFFAKLADSAEGWHQWAGTAPPGDARGDRSVAGAAWWTDYTGRRHVRVIAYRRSLNRRELNRFFLNDGRLQPPLVVLYPEYTVTHTRGGESRLWVACACGAFGTPEEIAWMGECCGPCHDRRETAGGKAPVLRRWWRLAPKDDYLSAVAFSPDGQTLATNGRSGKVRLWDVATGTERAVLEGKDGWDPTVLFTPDGRTLASTGNPPSGGIFLWDAATGALRHRVPVDFAVSCLRCSPGGTLFAGFGNRLPVLWDTATGERLPPFPDSAFCFHFDLAFSPDGNLLAVPGDGTIKLWDTVTREQRDCLQVPWARAGVRILAVAFSPLGNLLAAGGVNRGVRLWDLAKREEGPPLPGSKSVTFSSVDFSPDGRIVAGICQAAVKFWDVERRQELAALGFDERVRDLAFSPDGQLLATARGTVRLWPREVFAGS